MLDGRIATCVRALTSSGQGADSSMAGTESSMTDPGDAIVARLRGEALDRHPMFAGLTRDQVERLLHSSRIEVLNPGKLLYSRGEPSRRFFLILEGQVHLSLYTAHGAEKIIDILGPGDVFAEAVGFMERPVYQMTATAATAARVMSFQNQGYIEILRENSAACLRVLRHLSSRLHVRLREIGGIVLENATSRLVRLLEERMPADATDSATIHLEESRQELASYLAIKPETLSRSLRTLADGGAIVVHGKIIEVVSRARLRMHLDDAQGTRLYE
jgi:CRP-like cAMP-binding protein